MPRIDVIVWPGFMMTKNGKMMMNHEGTCFFLILLNNRMETLTAHPFNVMIPAREGNSWMRGGVQMIYRKSMAKLFFESQSIYITQNIEVDLKHRILHNTTSEEIIPPPQ